MKFIRFSWLYFLISGLALTLGLASLFLWGLKPSIDFQGGSVLEVKFNSAIEYKKLNSFVDENFSGSQLTELEKTGRFSIRTREISNQEKDKFIVGLKKEFGELEEVRFASIGPSLGRELLVKALTGILLAALGILFYVSLRFKEKSFGICAILAMFHDSLILLGVFSLLGHFRGVEIDSLFVTAALTTLSFSVHDTIVVYDRIRELSRLYPVAHFSELADAAITQTLTRSFNNSMTIIFVLISLFLLGGETTRWFSLALLVGTISGTYSSTFTAVPLLVFWRKRFSKDK